MKLFSANRIATDSGTPVLPIKGTSGLYVLNIFNVLTFLDHEESKLFGSVSHIKVSINHKPYVHRRWTMCKSHPT